MSLNLQASASIPVLKAFSRALGREAHVLTREPSLLWQQMYNRLQWEGKDVGLTLAPELAHRSRASASLWIKLLTPMQESSALVRVLEGDTDTVKAVAFSPDGKFLATASRCLRIWDTASWQELHAIKGGKYEFKACKFSADSRYIYAGSDDHYTNSGELRVWETTSGKEAGNLGNKKKLHGVQGFDLSPDGNSIASVSNWDLLFWDLPSGRLLEEQSYKGSHECAYSPDGQRIVSSYKNQLFIWDTASRQVIFTLKARGEDIYTCRYSPDGLLIATGDQDGTLRLLDAQTGKRLRTMNGHTKGVSSCAFSPDGSFIVSAEADNTLRLWDTSTGKLLSTYEGHTGWVRGCAISPDGRFIASASSDQQVRIWHASGNQAPPEQAVHIPGKEVCCLSPDGHILLTDKGTDGQLWDFETGVQLTTLSGHREKIHTGAFSPDGRRILTGSRDLNFRIWEAATGKLLTTLAKDFSHFPSGTFSPDGCHLLIGAEVWNADTGTVHKTLWGHKDLISTGAISPDGKSMLTAGYSEMMLRKFPEDGVIKVLVGHPGWTRAVAYSPDGHSVITAHDKGNLHGWNAHNGELLQTFITRPHNNACAFTPDGQAVISAGEGKIIQVWKRDSGELMGSLPLPGTIHSLAVHPWKPLLFCGTEGGTAYQMELVTLQYGPIIVTARHNGSGLTVVCPSCLGSHSISADQLGEALICPRSECGLRLKVNPFFIQAAGTP